MSLDAWLGALLFVVLLWAGRRIYSKGKAGTRRWGRGTLFFSIAISALAYPAFQFVIVKSFVGSETGWLFEVARMLVVTAIFFNLFFSAHLLGVLSRASQDGQSAASPDGTDDQAHA
jgi:hypothetical protein